MQRLNKIKLAVRLWAELSVAATIARTTLRWF